MPRLSVESCHASACSSTFQVPEFFTTEFTEQHREKLGVGFQSNYKESIDCFVMTP